MIEIIKNLPSKNFTEEDKKEALLEFVKSDNINAITKCELQNAIIYLLSNETYESRQIASLVEKMNEATNVHELNSLYNEAEKILFLVYGVKANYLMKEMR